MFTNLYSNITINKYEMGHEFNLPAIPDEYSTEKWVAAKEGDVLLYIAGQFFLRKEGNDFVKLKLEKEFVDLNPGLFKPIDWI